ncbi:2882_t:CDS:2, partial [Entrophospora sp. SA101]
YLAVKRRKKQTDEFKEALDENHVKKQVRNLYEIAPRLLKKKKNKSHRNSQLAELEPAYSTNPKEFKQIDIDVDGSIGNYNATTSQIFNTPPPYDSKAGEMYWKNNEYVLKRAPPTTGQTVANDVYYNGGSSGTNESNSENWNVVTAVGRLVCSTYWDNRKRDASACDTLHPDALNTPTCSCSQDYIEAYTCYYLCMLYATPPYTAYKPQSYVDKCVKLNYNELTVPSKPNCPGFLKIPSSATVDSTTKDPIPSSSKSPSKTKPPGDSPTQYNSPTKNNCNNVTVIGTGNVNCNNN